MNDRVRTLKLPTLLEYVEQEMAGMVLDGSKTIHINRIALVRKPKEWL